MRWSRAWVVAALAIGCGPDLDEAVSSGGPGGDDGGGTSESASTGTSTAGETSGPPVATGTMGGDGSSGPPPGGDDTTGDPAAGTDTGASGGPHDGTYSGTVAVTISPNGFTPANCGGAATFTVVEGAGIPIIGTSSCAVTFVELGFPITIEGMFSGTVAPTAGDLLISSVGISDVTSWTGELSGDAFTGSFAGDTNIMGNTATYSGTFTTMR